MLVALLWQGPAHAANPLKPADPKYHTFDDPHGFVFEDRVYLFASHDASPQNKGFVLWDWWVWSSADLVSWDLESVLKPESTYIGKPFKDCWATFGVQKNNQWYWYVSMGSENIAVFTADSPKGPWRDVLGKPLIPAGLTHTQARDPEILLDDDGAAYMVYGTFNYYIVRLNPDMISLAEKPRQIVIRNPEGPYGKGKTDDKPSLHKRDGIYYLSWSSHYAMSTNVYGPYEYKGSVIEPGTVADDFRQKDLDWDRHGNFLEFNNQWYYACNDHSQPGQHKYYRNSIMMYVHYRDNGEIAPVRIDRIGVGEYDAAQGRIEAEDYFKSRDAEKRECKEGGFEMRLRQGSALYYPKVHNLPAMARLRLSVACANPGGARVEVRDGSPKGALLGSVHIEPTGGWDVFKEVPCLIENKAGTTDLCLFFGGEGEEILRMDWMSFSMESRKVNQNESNR